jgi:hypothetical protein
MAAWLIWLQFRFLLPTEMEGAAEGKRAAKLSPSARRNCNASKATQYQPMMRSNVSKAAHRRSVR